MSIATPTHNTTPDDSDTLFDLERSWLNEELNEQSVPSRLGSLAIEGYLDEPEPVIEAAPLYPREAIDKLDSSLDASIRRPEAETNPFTKMLDAMPGLQDYLINEFRNRTDNSKIERIVASRSFIEKISSDALAAIEADKNYFPYRKQALLPEQLSALTNALLDRSGFTRSEQRELLGDWNKPVEGAMNSRLRRQRRAGQIRGIECTTKNLAALGNLYGYDPEAPHKLRATYGIRNFGRYYNQKTGKSVLIPQLAKNYRGNGNVALIATQDHNNAFEDPELDTQYVKMEDPTYVEAASPVEALTRLLKLNRNGRISRIQRLYVGAYGENERIADLTTQQLKKFRGLERIKPRLFTPDSEIILDSCTTGMKRKRSIAARLNQRTGITVNAPRSVSTGMILEPNGKYVYEEFENHRKRRQARQYDGRYMPRHATKRRLQSRVLVS